MPHRIHPPPPARYPPLRAAAALRRTLRAGYRLADLRADALAGLVVGLIALPLSMALAIATGVPPQHGLYTAIVAGTVAALLGGSPVQVTGPTAAFVVVLAPLATQFGLVGLMLATAFAGGLLVLMGVARLGRLIEFVPFPVTTGFTAGIAIVIATLQTRDLLGLRVEHMPDHFLERVATLVQAGPTARWPDMAVGALTLVALFLLPRVVRRFPAPLIALPLGVMLALLLSHSGYPCETIQSRFHGIPQSPPVPLWPWAFDGPPAGTQPLTPDALRPLLLASVTIALLGAIESLLSAVVGAGMSGQEHDPDAELIAQGAANLVAPFFGGFAATGAIARTATNIRSGARSPLAAVFHSVFLLVGVLVAAPWLGYLPMASMAALLVVVAWNMSEVRHVVHMLRVAPRSDNLIMLTCLGLTVLFDMTVAVTVGVALAALLFMQRMAELTGVRLVTQMPTPLARPLPPGILVYEVAGPLFFGAAQRAMNAIKAVDRSVAVVVLDLRAVPVMDATGLVNLESALRKLHDAQIYTIIAGIQDQPLALLARAGWKHRDWLSVYRSFEHGIETACNLAHLLPLGNPAAARS